MPTNNRTRLIALTQREFERQVGEPVTLPTTKSFRPMKLKLARFDRSWDRRRGNAMRLTGVLLNEGDTDMQRRVCENGATAKTYASAVSWL
jgi:hypothetical protein